MVSRAWQKTGATNTQCHVVVQFSTRDSTAVHAACVDKPDMLLLDPIIIIAIDADSQSSCFFQVQFVQILQKGDASPLASTENL